MKRAILKAIKILLGGITVLGLAVVIFLYYTGNPQHIRGQDIIATYPSPNGTYILTTYLNNGGMTTDFSVLGRVKNIKTNKARNIYWKYHCTVSRVEWLDEDTVILNDIVLNVEKDMYTNNNYDDRYLGGDKVVDAVRRQKPN